LRSSLNSLDVDLEEELARFRRLHDRQQEKSRRRWGRRDRQLDFGPQPFSCTQTSTTFSAIADPLVINSDSHTETSQYPSPFEPPLEQVQPHSGMTPLALMVPPTPPSELVTSAAQQQIQPVDLSDDGSGHLSESPYGLATPDEPEDYLESSEELLKSLAEEEAELRGETQPGVLESLLTPLGIGSMLLLLLTSATFGYLMMNPAAVSLLGLEPTVDSGKSATGASTTSPVGGSPSVNIPEAPNLAADEFVDLNLETLSNLPQNASASITPARDANAAPASSTSLPEKTPVAAPAPTQPSPEPIAEPSPHAASAPVTVPRSTPAAARPAAPASRPAATREQPRPIRERPAPAAPASPTPAARPPEPAPPVAVNRSPELPPDPIPAAPSPASPTNQTPAPVRQDLYYVVTEYNGDRSLEQAQQAVDEAYVRNFPDEGARVQMGAFSSEVGAQELIQELEQQGIAAEVLQPPDK
jgi:hypothetical protein